MKNASITKAQIKVVHSLKSALQLDDPTYRAILGEWFQVGSSKDLSSAQAEVMIRELKEIAVSAGVWEQRPARKKKFDEFEGRRGGMATPAQLRKIDVMWKEVSRVTEPEGRKNALRAFLERVVKISDPRFLNSEAAGKVINALNSMRKRKAA
jgi:hypothetical protein